MQFSGKVPIYEQGKHMPLLLSTNVWARMQQRT